MSERGNNLEAIEKIQEVLAQTLVNSFYYGEGSLDDQLEYWEMTGQISGIDILLFSPSELMKNNHIREKLIQAFKDKHGDKNVKEEKIPGRIKFQLLRAFKRNQTRRS